MLTAEIIDDKFEDVALVEVRPVKDGYELKRADGWSFWLPDNGIEPHAGDKARFYGDGIGRPVRGVAINGVVVFYRTEVEQAEKNRQEQGRHYAERQAELDASVEARDTRWASLPQVFQDRRKRFEANNPTWRRDFEPYELFCCEQAAAIAKALDPGPATTSERPKIIAAKIAAFREASEEVKREQVPSLDDGHSGNTFDFACRLARWFLERPELVAQDHGAMCLIVGCREYGCQ
jgi:hypothetical protein